MQETLLILFHLDVIFFSIKRYLPHWHLYKSLILLLGDLKRKYILWSLCPLQAQIPLVQPLLIILWRLYLLVHITFKLRNLYVLCVTPTKALVPWTQTFFWAWTICHLLIGVDQLAKVCKELLEALLGWRQMIFLNQDILMILEIWALNSAWTHKFILGRWACFIKLLLFLYILQDCDIGARIWSFHSVFRLCCQL